jgi:hypothetical protein
MTEALRVDNEVYTGSEYREPSVNVSKSSSLMSIRYCSVDKQILDWLEGKAEVDWSAEVVGYHIAFVQCSVLDRNGQQRDAVRNKAVCGSCGDVDQVH